MRLFAAIPSEWLFAAGCALLTSILLRRSYRYYSRNHRRKNEPAIAAQPRPASTWSGAHADASARVERQKVELYDMGRDIRAQIDNKMTLLGELVVRSQRQIDRMERLLAEMDEQSAKTR